MEATKTRETKTEAIQKKKLNALDQERTINDKVYFKGKKGKAMRKAGKIIKEMQQDSITQSKEIVKNKKGLKKGEAGRPSKLTPENWTKILQGAKEGKTLQEMAKKVGIPYKTIEGWYYQNYGDFKDNWLRYKHEGLLNKSEEVSREILEMPIDMLKVDNDGESVEIVRNIDVVKVKQNESQFIRKTIGSSEYKDKAEEEEDSKIIVNVVNFYGDNKRDKEVVAEQTGQA